jgi:hypothetical protein
MMNARTMVTALAGALLALAIVGGFMALDRTVLHWYAQGDQPVQIVGPAPTTELPKPSNTADAAAAASDVATAVFYALGADLPP